MARDVDEQLKELDGLIRKAIDVVKLDAKFTPEEGRAMIAMLLMSCAIRPPELLKENCKTVVRAYIDPEGE